jgi:hypothetical protein
LRKVGLADSARTTEVVTKVVVLGGALRKSLPVSVGVNLNSVASDACRAASCLPRDSGSAVSRYSTDNSSSRSGGYGVDCRSRPLTGSAGASSTDSKANRVSTGVLSEASQVVKRYAVGVVSLVSRVKVNVLVLSISRLVLELVSESSIDGVGSPVNVDTVLSLVELDARSGHYGNGVIIDSTES